MNIIEMRLDELTPYENNPRRNDQAVSAVAESIKEFGFKVPIVVDKSVEHPTMKPLKLLARQIKNSSRKGELVLDTFGGSGSTLLACDQLGRVCYTAELDPKYCDVIIQRWEQATGNKAVKIGGQAEQI